MSQVSHTGQCSCGAVRYVVTGPLRPIIGCHCRMCRRTSGHFVMATAAKRSDFHMTHSSGLSWYQSSPGIRRGFCMSCGSNLFWDKATNPYISIWVGSLDDDSGLTVAGHIFAAEKGHYYQIDDGTPVFAGDWVKS